MTKCGHVRSVVRFIIWSGFKCDQVLSVVRFQMWPGSIFASGSKCGHVPNWVRIQIGSGFKLGQVPLVTTNLHTKFEDRRPMGSLVIDQTRTKLSIFYLSGAITLDPPEGIQTVQERNQDLMVIQVVCEFGWNIVINKTAIAWKRPEYSVFGLSGAVTLEPLRGYGRFKKLKGTKILCWYKLCVNLVEIL